MVFLVEKWEEKKHFIHRLANLQTKMASEVDGEDGRWQLKLTKMSWLLQPGWLNAQCISLHGAIGKLCSHVPNGHLLTRCERRDAIYLQPKHTAQCLPMANVVRHARGKIHFEWSNGNTRHDIMKFMKWNVIAIGCKRRFGYLCKCNAVVNC